MTSFTAYRKIVRTYSKDEMRDIARHGCVSGVAHSHIYYKQTCEFFDKYEEEILEKLEEISMNPLMEASEHSCSIRQLKNELTWRFVELVCHQEVNA